MTDFFLRKIYNNLEGFSDLLFGEVVRNQEGNIYSLEVVLNTFKRDLDDLEKILNNLPFVSHMDQT